jgi:glycosyltransferase involved in cell wall biosynthesis
MIQSWSGLLNRKRLIVIPAYNEEKQIAAVIDGVRRYSDADVVVIDDGSTDRTFEFAVSKGVIVVNIHSTWGWRAVQRDINTLARMIMN